MIPARPTSWLKAFFRWHLRHRFARAFERVQVRGLDSLRDALEAGPCVVVANHTSWWDGLVAFLVSQHLPAPAAVNGYALMAAEYLADRPFLGRLGGFGMQRGDATDVLRALRYGARLLRQPRAMVWVFPQGRERPVTERPLGFAPGASLLARMAKASTVPVALRYEHGPSEKPVCWVSFGSALDAAGDPHRSIEEATRLVEEAVECEMAVIERAVRDLANTPGFEPILEAPPSALARLAERLLTIVTRY